MTPWLSWRISTASWIHHVVLSDSQAMTVASSQLITWFSVFCVDMVCDSQFVLLRLWLSLCASGVFTPFPLFYFFPMFFHSNSKTPACFSNVDLLVIPNKAAVAVETSIISVNITVVICSKFVSTYSLCLRGSTTDCLKQVICASEVSDILALYKSDYYYY